jgi:hypothetical protein
MQKQTVDVAIDWVSGQHELHLPIACNMSRKRSLNLLVADDMQPKATLALRKQPVLTPYAVALGTSSSSS